jgi:RNA polymerase sigma-70 factor, ECF subfamily
MNGGLSNAELVAGVRIADATARARLVQTYSVPLHRLLVGILGADPDLPDLLQDVFIAAFVSVGRLTSPHALPMFLQQIAINVANSHIRRNVRRRSLVRAMALTRPNQLASGNHAPCEASLLAKEILDRLPARERIPFALRFVLEMEIAEVAAACDISVPTVKRRLVAAQGRLYRSHLRVDADERSKAPRGGSV